MAIQWSCALTTLLFFTQLSIAENFDVAEPTVAANEPSYCGKMLTPALELDPSQPNPYVTEIYEKVAREVIGQGEAVSAAMDAISTSLTGLQDDERPLGRILFTGPTGVGKTETIKAQIRALGANPDTHLIRIDCGEFQAGHEISRLIGAPPSYVGYGDTPMLHKSELEKRQLKIKTPTGEFLPVNFILFDEIEKCHESVYNLLLGILDNGKVTLGDKSETFMRNAFIYATSNLGAQATEEVVRAKAAKLRGLDSAQREALSLEETDLTGRHDKGLRQQIFEIQQDALRGRFKPEFINRWSHVIQFLHLSKSEYAVILTKMMAQFQKRSYQNAIIKANYVLTNAARDAILDNGTNFLNGARELLRTIDRMVQAPLARLISSGQVLEGDVVEIDANLSDSKTLAFRVLGRGFERPELLQLADQVYPGFDMLKASFEKPKPPAENSAGDTTSLFSRLKAKPDLLKRLWNDSTDSIPQTLNIKAANGDVRVNVKYIRIGENLFELRLLPNKTIEISERSMVDTSLQGRITDRQIHRWTEEHIQKLLGEEKP